MYGSMPTKLARLAGAHLTHPAYTLRWLANLRRPPIESGLPWFTFAAIDFLDEWVKPHHTVFEYGCGGSTVFFAERAQAVVCIEHNDRWRTRVLQRLATLGLGNVLIGIEPAGRNPPLASSAYCRALDRSYDIVVVDGWALGKHTESDQRAIM